MRRFIHKLRQKPKSTRRKVALGTSASVTGLIFVVWLTVVMHGGGLTPTQNPQTQTASPISAIKGNASAAFSTLQNRLQDQSGTTSKASVNSARATTSSAEPEASTSERTGNKDVQRFNDQPYWRANDDMAGNGQPNQENARYDQRSQTSDNFWQEGQDGQDNSGGWF
jgi:cytoskeletal protein RodZ